jgi:hypothetical protein
MNFRVLEQRGLENARSPFRVVEDSGQEVEWVNRFLDQERVRSVVAAANFGHDHFDDLAIGIPLKTIDGVTQSGGLQQFLTSLSPRRTGTDLADLQGNRPAASGGILPHGVTLHRHSLLIVRGNAGVEAYSGRDLSFGFPLSSTRFPRAR